MPNEIEEGSGLDVASRLAGKKKWVTCSILLLVNLLNYMDRYTIVGVMSRLATFFDIDDKGQGLLQTVFIVFYMFFAPLFGYLGDRYNRKMLMITGICIWILAVFASSFCGEGHYYLFLLCRGIVGIGEASYSTIAPTVLSDLFSGGLRSRVLMMFYFAIPVGSGLGFISGSSISQATDSWQWGVRFSPIIGIACLGLMLWLLDEPVRGACDGARQNGDEADLIGDIKYLMSIKTFYLASAASIASFFSIGTMSWWTPQYVGFSYAVIHNVPKVPETELTQINLIFGIITCMAGLLGVATGSILSRAWRDGSSIFRNHATEKADVYICALSMFVALPFLFFAIFIAEYSTNGCLILIYFAIMSMCLNWSVNVDVLMYVVVANRRATALAVQTMVAHLFGDAASPYIIGVLSDMLRGDDASAVGHFFALQKALYVPTFMLVVAGAFYLAATFFVEDDRKEALYQMDAPDNWHHDDPSEDLDDLLSHENPETVEGVEEHPADMIVPLAHSDGDTA
ncbi:Major facilitator superfamily (MFS) profile domain-containing protein [Caenorhabditis elegans]|uniref:Major facilitator superfamily (MFS) profile domain-containing protein n=2 Tax=Caenorhabditis elegans TaxID=6239 RepID=A0A3B1DV80_CAEEL|nr:Major facilitator superfamily (MFS) profile domain-containing protein [Caenorhabditis elegans]VAX62855.1 Major facilitator superfamily (MFS) profile domain-containing protein [Caenorhabditis elegans]|eukprot:NP_001355396.1 SPINster (Drosophila lysosomal permease) homolog [Caenorhabditis elegans]